MKEKSILKFQNDFLNVTLWVALVYLRIYVLRKELAIE